MSIDFAALNRDLLSRAQSILFEWFRNGKVRGSRFVIGNLRGDAGDSLSIDIRTGVWADFGADASNSTRGGDLISLYAAKESITQVEAARRLGAVDTPKPNGKAQGKAHAEPEQTVIPKEVDAALISAEKPIDRNEPAPKDAIICRATIPGHPIPSALWAYRTPDGQLLGYDARYDYPDEKKSGGKMKKEVKPWRWDAEKNRWACKGFAAPSPLYGLEDLAARPEARVFLVEGCKSVDFGRKLIPQAVWVSWQGGWTSWSKPDLSPLYGRYVYLWPDADEGGIKAMLGIGNRLMPHCPDIVYLDPVGMPDGWDVADAVQGGMDFRAWQQWAKTRKREIKQKIAQEQIKKEESPKPPKVATPYQRLHLEWGLVPGANSQPIPNMDNIVRIFENDPNIKLGVHYDTFLQRVIDGKTGHQWKDSDELKLTLYIQRILGIPKISKETVRDAVLAVAHQQPRHCIQDWLKSLPAWDGTTRLDSLFFKYFGTPHNEYTANVGRCFMVSLVARAMIPGCKADNLVVFEGKQGIRKSSALEALVGQQWFATAHHEVTDKDFLQSLRGKWLIEIAELDSFQRSQLEAVKSMVSRRFDTYRMSYGHFTEDYLRQCIFAATTNKDNWNVDETGARRFWPIRTLAIDIPAILRDREQLFAEALALFMRVPLDADEMSRKAAGADWWLTPKELTEREQDDRYEDDPWTVVIEEFIGVRTTITVPQLLTEALKLDVGKQDTKEQRRVGRILRRLGWEKYTERQGSALRKAWRLPENSPNEF